MDIKEFIKKEKATIDFYIEKTIKFNGKITPAKREQFVRENENLRLLASLEGVVLDVT